MSSDCFKAIGENVLQKPRKSERVFITTINFGRVVLNQEKCISLIQKTARALECSSALRVGLGGLIHRWVKEEVEGAGPFLCWSTETHSCPLRHTTEDAYLSVNELNPGPRWVRERRWEGRVGRDA